MTRTKQSTLRIHFTAAQLILCGLLGSVVLADDDDSKASETAAATEAEAPVRRAALDIRPSEGKLPENQARQILTDDPNQNPEFLSNRLWPQTTYMWKAAAVSHRPLYFQDDNLERYGHHHGIFEPAISAAKFFGRVPLIPYMVGATPCDECQYALGYYRPGDCVPLHQTHPKQSVLGVAYQVAAVTGAVLVIP
ncbi:MAG: hypothetical protein R3C59_04775 [Planctomycetaceae bacterium]